MDDNTALTNEKNKLVNEFFEKTGIKLTQDEPAIHFYMALHQMMTRQMEEYQQAMTNFSHNLVDKTQNQLDNANEYFVGNIDILCENMDERTAHLLAQLDDKHKDLTFILTKIQGEYDKLLDERFEKHFKKISDEQAQTVKKLQSLADENLKRQRKIDTSKQRDIIVGFGGFVIGLLICLAMVFILK